MFQETLQTYTCSQLFDDDTCVSVGTTRSSKYTWTGGMTGTTFPSASGDVRLDGNGVVRGLAYIATSDEKAKTKISSISNANEIISKLVGKQYNWNTKTISETKVNNSLNYGFIAQEVAKILPSIVIVDKEGNYGINYDMIIPFLVENQKSLIKKIEDQQKDIEYLKSTFTTNKQIINQIDISLSSRTEPYLEQNVPNPFEGNTKKGYFIPTDFTNAIIQFNSMDGKKINEVRIVEKGKGIININSSDLAKGTYLNSLIIDGKIIDTKRMLKD